MGLIEKNLQRQNEELRSALRKMELSLRPPQGRENEIYQAGTVQFQNNVRQFAVEALDKVEDIEKEISSLDLLKERDEARAMVRRLVHAHENRWVTDDDGGEFDKTMCEAEKFLSEVENG